MAEASVIELRAGRGEPRQISLTPGSVLDPTSVGQAGMWRVSGGGVLDVHGYLYFDGKALFVQSADDNAPVMVNRHRVARAWTEVRMPSTIELGEVQLVYRIDTDGSMSFWRYLLQTPRSLMVQRITDLRLFGRGPSEKRLGCRRILTWYKKRIRRELLSR